MKRGMTMTLCLIPVNLVPDHDKVTTSYRSTLAISEDSKEDECISDREEIADVEKGVSYLIALGIAPFLIFLAAYYLLPESPIAVRSNPTEQSVMEP